LYPPIAEGTELETDVVGLTNYFEDPFQYPPPFLLLPRLALALTNDYWTIRTVWFALQTTAFALVSLLLALWIKGRSGIVAAFLIPAMWISLPAMDSFQSGQFHLTTLVLAVAALLAAEMRGRQQLSVFLGTCWVFLFFLPGVVPLPVFPPPSAMMILSGLGVVLMIALNSWVVLRRPSEPLVRL
jgi:hypothetical protein